MDGAINAYRRQLAAQLAQIMLQGRPEDVSPIPTVAVGLANAVTQLLNELEAEETAAVHADQCPETHPLDGLRCTYKTEVEHDLHRDDRGKEW